jgi:D-aminopeptidase
MAFGYKAGIGSSSRVTEDDYTVGVLVQANFGGVLELDGIPIGRPGGEGARRSAETDNQGSIMIVVATDAPLSDRNLTRLAWRAIAGLARTGSSFENGSGDYAIAFSAHPDCRRPARSRRPRKSLELANNSMSPLFRAAIEATEEAIYDSLLMAETMESTDTATGRRIVAESAAADVMRALERVAG